MRKIFLVIPFVAGLVLALGCSSSSAPNDGSAAMNSNAPALDKTAAESAVPRRGAAPEAGEGAR